MDAGNMLKPMLARGELRMVGATTLDEYREHIEKDPALERRFQPVLVGEPTRARTPSASCAGSRSATRCTTACGSPTPPWSPRPPCPTATSPTGSCRTRRSTWSTRPRPGCAWRSTRGRSRWTRSSGRCAAWRSRRWRWPRSRTRRSPERLARLRARAGRQARAAGRAARPVAHREGAHREDLGGQGAAGDAARRGRAGRARPRPGPRLRAALRPDPGAGAGSWPRPRRSWPRCRATARCSRRRSAPDDIAAVVASWTGIPAGRLMEGETAKLLRMEESLAERVVGQPEAVAAVSDAVRRARAGIADPDRPTGSLPVPRPDRGGQDRAGQGAGRVPLRRRAGHGPHRHERVRREALGGPAGRRPARLRRVRGGRPADRGGAAPAVLAWSCWTRSRRRTRRSSTCCCRCSTTAGSPTVRAARSTSATPS